MFVFLPEFYLSSQNWADGIGAHDFFWFEMLTLNKRHADIFCFCFSINEVTSLIFNSLTQCSLSLRLWCLKIIPREQHHASVSTRKSNTCWIRVQSNASKCEFEKQCGKRNSSSLSTLYKYFFVSVIWWLCGCYFIHCSGTVNVSNHSAVKPRDRGEPWASLCWS